MRPIEVLEQTFLMLSREDIEVAQISHRRFHSIISSENFQKITPLLTIHRLDLRDDLIAIWRNGVKTCFDYDSDETIHRLRNACVQQLEISTDQRDQRERHQNERAQRWLIPKLAAFRSITVSVPLPLFDQDLHEAFLRPNSTHQWMSVGINDASSDNDPPDRLRVPLVSSSLANAETLYLGFEDRRTTRQSLRVTTEDLVHWLHRPQAPEEAFSSTNHVAGVWDQRRLSIGSANIDGELQRFIEAIKEKFVSATTKLGYEVSITRVPDRFRQLVPKEGYRKFNKETGELLRIEFHSPYSGTRIDFNDIAIRRCPFF